MLRFLLLIVRQLQLALALTDQCVCDLPCGDVFNGTTLCDVSMMYGCCCGKSVGGDIIGIDLRNCSLTAIDSALFACNYSHFDRSKIEWIDLSLNALVSGNVSHAAFRGMTSLSKVVLPVDAGGCPGGGQAFEEEVVDSGELLCVNQTDWCVKMYALNFTCVANSACYKDGPGYLNCTCLPGYFGYKCLKSGEFPFAIFFGTLGSATLVLSIFLYYTQRRHVVSKPASGHAD